MENKRRNTAIKDSVFYFSFILFLAAYGWTLVQFVAHDSLSSFATDSANYMVMARYLSPWHEASTAIVHAWPEQDYPILFPLLLAWAGVAYDYYMAHALTALLLVVALPCIYVYARQVGLTRLHASLVVVMVAISPATWINSLGILSENLYLLLTVLTLFYYQRMNRDSGIQCILLGLLLGSVVITRSVGICMLAAYAVLCCHEYIKSRNVKLLPLLPVIVAGTIIIIAKVLHGSSIPSIYINEFSSVLSANDVDAYRDYSLLNQIVALVDAWFSGWLYYWNNNMVASYLVFVLAGLLAVIGMVLRGYSLRLDALYLLLYLLILLIWPHPGQALRFIYPVQFLLVIFAGYTIITITRHLQSTWQTRANTIMYVILLTSIIPAQVYTWHRYQEGKVLGYQFYKEFYQLHNREAALDNAEIQSVMHRDMLALGKLTQPDDIIMYLIPAYISLLSDRKAIEIKFFRDDDGNVQLDKTEPADYVYLSSLHPRKTGPETNGLYIYSYFKDWTDLVNVSYTTTNNKPVSYLLRVN